MKLIIVKFLIIIFFLMYSVCFAKEKILAVVDGKLITEEDLKYFLGMQHFKKNLPSKTPFKISVEKYIQKLIDEKLIINEAKKMGIDQDPEVKKAIEDFILRESVKKLYDEEIRQKVFVTEKEIKDYYLKKIKKGEKLSEEDFQKRKNTIEKIIRREKEKKRSDEYLACLRSKAKIKINKELLSSNKTSDKTPLVEVDGDVLTVEDFIKMAKDSNLSEDEVINLWIDRKLIDKSALSKHYERNPEFKKVLSFYKDTLLKNMFIKKVIIPQIRISDQDLEEYYKSHQKDFAKPASYYIQQITVKSKKSAEEILDSLKKGADFSWVAKTKSIDALAEKGGKVGWVTKAELFEPLKEIIDSMNIGDISPIIEFDSKYIIVKLLDKTDEEIEKFDKVKNLVYNAYFNEQVDKLLNEYVSKLRKKAKIKIYEKQIKLFVKSLEKSSQK